MKKSYISFLILISLIFLLIACNEAEGNHQKETTKAFPTDHIHVEEILPAIPAICTEAGLSEGIRCSDCNEILIAQEVVPALGHHYVEGVCAECNHKVTQGLTFSLNQDKTSYAVSGIGTAIETDICIRDTYNGLPVTSIADEAFRSCSSLKSIEIPVGITSIGNGAFSYCSNLTSVYLPNSVTSIGICAFSYCSSLTDIDLPDALTNLGASAFEYCGNLKSIAITDGIVSLADNLFYHCTSLKNVEISNSVTEIGVSAFGYCTDLESMILPHHLNSIGYDAFACCGKLTNIKIPSGVRSIGEYAFNRCSSLATIAFDGTKAQWSSITKGHGWNFSTGSYTVQCSDGNLNK